MRHGSEEKNDTNRNVVTGMMIDGERTMTWIVKSENTLWTITDKETIEGTWNGEHTQTKTDDTQNDRGTATTDAIRTTVGKIFGERIATGVGYKHDRPQPRAAEAGRYLTG